MAKGNVFAFTPKAKLHRYALHTDNPDVVRADSPKHDPEKHGFVSVHTHSNGVKEHVDPEYGSTLFTAHAPNMKEARSKINEAHENYSARESAAYDRTMAGATELFRRDKAEIKPFKKPE